MKEITTLIPALGDLINGADWMKLINWAFWFLLAIVAAGGIICAVFGKKSLINRGISGMLSIIMLYLTAIMLFVYIPTLRDTISELPFLSVGEQQITLLDPARMELISVLCPLLLRFFIMALSINLMESVWPNGEGFLSWVIWRMVSMICALMFNWIICAGIQFVIPSLLGKYAFVPLVLVFGGAIIVLAAKVIFTVLITTANPYFGAVYGFFTINQVGNLFTKTVLTTVLSWIMLLWLNKMGLAVLPYSTFEGAAFFPTCLMFLGCLYIFAKIFNDKK